MLPEKVVAPPKSYPICIHMSQLDFSEVTSVDDLPFPPLDV